MNHADTKQVRTNRTARELYDALEEDRGAYSRLPNQLVTINGEAVGPWLVEHMRTVRDDIDPDYNAVDITVWIGDRMVGIQLSTYKGQTTGDQTATFAPEEN